VYIAIGHKGSGISFKYRQMDMMNHYPPIPYPVRPLTGPVTTNILIAKRNPLFPEIPVDFPVPVL